MSEEGTIQEAQAEGTQISEAKKPTKQEIARQRILEERRQRHLNRGVPENMVAQVMAREDYERLPIEEKLKRLENSIGSAIRQLAAEISDLRNNDGEMALGMDVRFTALHKILLALGVDADTQQAAVDQAAKDVQDAIQAAEEKRVASSALKEDHQGEASPPPAPEEATSFGGSEG